MKSLVWEQHAVQACSAAGMKKSGRSTSKKQGSMSAGGMPAVVVMIRGGGIGGGVIEITKKCRPPPHQPT